MKTCFKRAAALFLIATHLTAEAATYTIGSSQDRGGVGSYADDGTASGAIMAANSSPGNTIDFVDGITVTITSASGPIAITQPMTITNDLPGMVTLQNTDPSGGLLTVNAGTADNPVVLTTNGATNGSYLILSNGTLTINSSGYLQCHGNGSAIFDLINPVTVSNAGTLDLTNAGVQYFDSLSGTGDLMLAPDNSVLFFNGGNVSGNITEAPGSYGSGLFHNSGTLTLSGNNSFTHGIHLNGGTLSVSADAHLGASGSYVEFAGGTPVLQLTGSGFTSSNRPLYISNSSATISVPANTFTFSGPLVTNSSGTPLTIGANGDTGTLQLTHANTTFANNNRVTINPGVTLSLISGGGLPNAGMVMVNGTLLGTGMLGPVTVTSGGTIGPAQMGTLTLNYLTLFSGSNLLIEFDSTGATSSVSATAPPPPLLFPYPYFQNSATLDGTLQLSPNPGTYTPGTTYTIVTAPGGVSGTFSNVIVMNANLGSLTPTVTYNATDVTVTLN